MTATPAMAITVADVIIGPCSYFDIDGSPIGGTSGGVSIEMKETTQEIQVDQIAAPAAYGVKSTVMTIKTMLSEVTLANLQLAWDNPTAPVTGTTPASQTLNLGLHLGKKKLHALKFIGPCPPGPTGSNFTQRTYTVTQAVTVVSGAHVISKDKEVLFPVEFTVIPDFTQAGHEFGTIVDA